MTRFTGMRPGTSGITLFLTTALATSTWAQERGDGTAAESTAAAAEKPTPTVELGQLVRGDQTHVGLPLRGGPQAPVRLLIGDSIREFENASGDLTPGPVVPLDEVSALGLASGLTLEDEVVREHCAEILERQGPSAHAAIAPILKAELVDSRRLAAKILAAVEAREHANAIANTLRDDDPWVRRYSLRAYCLIGSRNDRFARCLSAFQFDCDDRVRHEAVEQFTRLGDRQAIEPLVLNYPQLQSRGLKLKVHRALRKLTGQKLGQDPAQWTAWWEHHERESEEPTPDEVREQRREKPVQNGDRRRTGRAKGPAKR